MGKDIQQPGHVALDDDFLQQLTTGLSGEQQLWLSGYLYGVSTSKNPADITGRVITTAETPVSRKLTILYGSQTGNSKSVAHAAAERIGQAGWDTAVQEMTDFTIRDLKKVDYLLVVVSTYGEGEPPAGAEEFHAALMSKRAPKLDKVKYAVLALGDKSYVQFCQTGIEFDDRLAELGAARLSPRVDCDVDFHDDADAWIEQLHQLLQSENPASTNGNGHAINAFVKSNGQPVATQPAYSRKNPFEAEVLEKIQLNGRGSVRETWHVELSLEGSGLQYKAGDALGVWTDNPDRLVAEVLKTAGFKATEKVEIEGRTQTLGDVLKEKTELSTLNRDILQKHAEHTGTEKLKKLIADPDNIASYVWGRDVADLLREFPANYSPQQLVNNLRKLQPRLYSIASGGEAYPDEVHLTVGAVRYESQGRRKEGAASSFLADRLDLGDTARVFIETNEYFRLPDDGDTPVIMIGPGTGIAPFRAFLQDREERSDQGSNWLFFGNPHFTTDFLYQTEWQKALKKGLLHRLNVAFSRDQKDKLYVQHKLLEKGEKVFEWLENGANIYICGDKNRMAPDVRKATQTLIQQHGGLSDVQTTEYFKKLVKERRYVEDVY